MVEYTEDYSILDVEQSFFTHTGNFEVNYFRGSDEIAILNYEANTGTLTLRTTSRLLLRLRWRLAQNQRAVKILVIRGDGCTLALMGSFFVENEIIASCRELNVFDTQFGGESRLTTFVDAPKVRFTAQIVRLNGVIGRPTDDRAITLARDIVIKAREQLFFPGMCAAVSARLTIKAKQAEIAGKIYAKTYKITSETQLTTDFNSLIAGHREGKISAQSCDIRGHLLFGHEEFPGASFSLCAVRRLDLSGQIQFCAPIRNLTLSTNRKTRISQILLAELESHPSVVMAINREKVKYRVPRRMTLVDRVKIVIDTYRNTFSHQYGFRTSEIAQNREQQLNRLVDAIEQALTEPYQDHLISACQVALSQLKRNQRLYTYFIPWPPLWHKQSHLESLLKETLAKAAAGEFAMRRMSTAAIIIPDIQNPRGPLEDWAYQRYGISLRETIYRVLNVAGPPLLLALLNAAAGPAGLACVAGVHVTRYARPVYTLLSNRPLSSIECIGLSGGLILSFAGMATTHERLRALADMMVSNVATVPHNLEQLRSALSRNNYPLPSQAIAVLELALSTYPLESASFACRAGQIILHYMLAPLNGLIAAATQAVNHGLDGLSQILVNLSPYFFEEMQYANTTTASANFVLKKENTLTALIGAFFSYISHKLFGDSSIVSRILSQSLANAQSGQHSAQTLLDTPLTGELAERMRRNETALDRFTHLVSHAATATTLELFINHGEGNLPSFPKCFNSTFAYVSLSLGKVLSLPFRLPLAYLIGFVLEKFFEPSTIDSHFRELSAAHLAQSAFIKTLLRQHLPKSLLENTGIKLYLTTENRPNYMLLADFCMDVLLLLIKRGLTCLLDNLLPKQLKKIASYVYYVFNRSTDYLLELYSDIESQRIFDRLDYHAQNLISLISLGYLAILALKQKFDRTNNKASTLPTSPDRFFQPAPDSDSDAPGRLPDYSNS